MDAWHQFTRILYFLDDHVVLLTPWSKDRPYVWMEIGMFRGVRKRVVGVLYGLTASDVATDERIPIVLKKIDLVDLNQVTSYFVQLKRRAVDWSERRVAT